MLYVLQPKKYMSVSVPRPKVAQSTVFPSSGCLAGSDEIKMFRDHSLILLKLPMKVHK